MCDWIKTAKVGDRVVCIDADDLSTCRPLKCGDVYVIREIIEWHGEFGIFLEEIHNEANLWGEYGYYARRFRPVTPRKTDIAIFERMLKVVGKPVEEIV